MPNISTTGVPKGEERENMIETVFEEKMAENFPELARNINPQIQRAG